MPNGLNLRGDLAKLSGAALTERLEAAWTTVDGARQQRLHSFWPFYSFRGPVRHPRAYRFLALLQLAEAGPIGLLAAWLLSSDRITGAMMDASPDMALREVRDIHDEIERRLRARKSAGG